MQDLTFQQMSLKMKRKEEVLGMRYEIKGDTLPVVVCYLEGGEQMITERGSMSWMSPNMKMETTTNGGIGKAFGRMFSGEAMFQNRYTAMGGNGMIAFASSFPGQILARQIVPGQELIVQKTGFLASEAGVSLSVYFQKKLGAGFSVEKDLLCRDCQEMEWLFWNLMVMSCSMIFSRDSRSSWIQGILQQWKGHAV